MTNAENAVSARWDDHAIALLKKLWVEEGRSGLAIARTMGLTRSAIMGKVHRLGITRNESSSVQSLQQKVRLPRIRKRGPRKPGKPKVHAPISLAEIAPRTFGGAKTLMELGPRDCRWTEGITQPGFGFDLLFCGAPTEPGKRYCADCLVKLIRPTTKEEKRAISRLAKVY